jgi:PKD repeat protein
MKKQFIISISFVLAMIAAQAQIISNFEGGDTDNWHSEGDGDYYWEDATGNPGACFRVDDDATGDWNNAFAPVKFLGNWSAANTTDYVTADIFLHPVATSYGSNIFVFQISGPGGTAKAFIGSQPPFDTWTTYTAYLDPANWTMVSGDWNLLLDQVNELIVRAEYISGDEFNRIDNVELSFTPVVIPVVPVLCSDFEAVGYDGWSFISTGGVSNQTSGGNPGRCIRISDGSGISMAYPPPKFLGDWTLLDNHAADIIVDIKVTGYSGTLLSNDYFLQIEGPGGSAKISLPGSIEEAYDIYKTFTFPIEESSWTVTSGTWNALMTHVNSFEIIMEFIDGSETVWMDNFCISNIPTNTDFIANKEIEFIGNPIQFTDLTAQGPTNWDWDFGDGNSSNEQHPEHAYLNSGLFTVSLTTSNFFGSNTETKTAYIEILDDTQCLKFEDDFEDASIYPVWGFNNGSWVESSGYLRQTGNYYGSGYLNGCYALIGSPLWQDYVITCDFRSTDNDGIGFVFNYVDDQNMYMFHWNTQENERLLIKWENGVQNILASDAITYVSSTWYHAEIATIEGNISVKIDGLEIMNVEDATFTNGKAGPYCWANDESHFDNFQVHCSGILVDVTAFLEGPFEATEMNTTLFLEDFIPLANPYSGAPWNYSGLDNVYAVTDPNICDWVLVELRDAPTAAEALPATVVGMKAGFILKDGSIVDINNLNPLRFTVGINDQAFAVVHHRNHLAVMSASPLIESAGVYHYDFSTGSGQAFGTGAQKDLGSGIFGLYAGDLNADGIINDLDKDISWGTEAGLSGYLQSDGNLDGEAGNKDKNDFWLINNNKLSQVPE